jgi:hypothetical protein
VTHLRKMMLEELQRRNYAETTTLVGQETGLLFSCHKKCRESLVTTSIPWDLLSSTRFFAAPSIAS